MLSVIVLVDRVQIQHSFIIEKQIHCSDPVLTPQPHHFAPVKTYRSFFPKQKILQTLT